MKPLQIRIDAVTAPGLSSFIIFGRAIKGMNFSKRVIRQHFNKYVEKDDYQKSDKNKLLEHLYNLTLPKNIPHKVGNHTKFDRPIVKNHPHEPSTKLAQKARREPVLGR